MSPRYSAGTLPTTDRAVFGLTQSGSYAEIICHTLRAADAKAIAHALNVVAGDRAAIAAELAEAMNGVPVSAADHSAALAAQAEQLRAANLNAAFAVIDEQAKAAILERNALRVEREALGEYIQTLELEIRRLRARYKAVADELSAFKAAHDIGLPQEGHREMVWREATEFFYECAGTLSAETHAETVVKAEVHGYRAGFAEAEARLRALAAIADDRLEEGPDLQSWSDVAGIEGRSLAQQLEAWSDGAVGTFFDLAADCVAAWAKHLAGFEPATITAPAAAPAPANPADHGADGGSQEGSASGSLPAMSVRAIAATTDEIAEAVRWHERQAQSAMGSLSCGSENWEYREAHKVCGMHRLAVEALRASSSAEESQDAEASISPLVGEMPGKAEGGETGADLSEDCAEAPPSGLPGPGASRGSRPSFGPPTRGEIDAAQAALEAIEALTAIEVGAEPQKLQEIIDLCGGLAQGALTNLTRARSGGAA
ncbi:hypothetical protein [Aurantimonas sp. VKM B-3413]|uniref:hypothetical protein n=1 Tax=Aurantimonas sp. VKM B-3413 TaxID=2779401 RepID=UPI001E45CD73|nr:hypothetical protein [Aurantimonas sp. VKM B-3413]MCB8835969.1 hypothetical protein [Aurantimonas sp. VKM B-3413]